MLNRIELADLHTAGKYAELWQLALPCARIALASLIRSGAVKAHDIDDDARQVAALAVGHAIPAWVPWESALFTYVTACVRGELLNHMNSKNNSGIGSRRQAEEGKPIVVIHLQDPCELEDEEEGTQGDVLTYDGLRLPTGQYDGCGDIPEGLGDPADEAERLIAIERMQNALNQLDLEDRVWLEESAEICPRSWVSLTANKMRRARAVQNSKAKVLPLM